MEEAGQQGGRGLFIVVEGIDGSGSTTQVREVVRFLRDRGGRAFATHEPSDGPAGQLIRLALNHRLVSPPADGEPASELDPAALALLFAADRVDHMRTRVEPNLRRGTHVVTDRYLLSSLAYQGVYFDREWVLSINRFAVRPDLTIFLDLLPEQSMARIELDRDRKDIYENVEHLSQVRQRYLDVIDAGPPELGPIVTLDAARPAAAVTQHIHAILERFLSTGEVSGTAEAL